MKRDDKMFKIPSCLKFVLCYKIKLNFGKEHKVKAKIKNTSVKINKKREKIKKNNKIFYQGW